MNTGIGSRRLRCGWICMLCTLVMVMTACRPNEPVAQGTTDRAPVQADTLSETPEGFGLVRAYPDDAGDSIAIALEFSEPLVGIQDFDQLIRFEEAMETESGWVLSDDATILRFPFVEPAKDYTVIISADLLAAGGATLGNEIKRTINTGQLKPVVGFASQGSVLPARESRGLPVVSVNVTEVDVEFFRVKEAALPQFLSLYKRSGQRGVWELEGEYGENKPIGQMAESVYLNRFVLGGKQNERVLSYLPIQNIRELQPSGLYFAILRRAGTFPEAYETTFFTVSDIGLHTRAYKDRLYVHTASLHDGAPLRNVDLNILNAQGEIILKGATDAAGNALLEYALDASHMLVARRANDVSMLHFNQPALDLSEFSVAGRQQAWFDVFAWSGRDLYRPGETVRIAALLRDYDGKRIESQPVFLRLIQPDGKIFRETQLEPGEQGYFGFEQAIPAEAPTGTWKVEFRTDPTSKEIVQGMALRIEEFLPERMKLDLSSPQTQLKPDEPLKLHAEAAYLYGAPAAGNRFSAKLTVRVEQHPIETLPGYFFGDPTVTLPRDAKDVIDESLNDAGIIEQDIPLPEEVKPVTPVAVMLNGSVYETGGRTVNRTLKRVMWPNETLVGIRPMFDDKEGADANGTARFELMRVNSQGEAKPAEGLQITLVRELRDYHWRYVDGQGWDYDFTRRFENKEKRTVNAGTSATQIDFPVEWGEYRVDVFDPTTGLTMRYPFRAGWSWDDQNRGLDARPDKVKIALDKTRYLPGDTLKVTLIPPQAGRGVLLVESDHILHSQNIDLGASGGTYEIPVTDDWNRHDIYVTALVFRGGSAASQITPARAVGVAHVPINRNDRRVAVGLAIPERMQPGRDLPVTVSVPQLAGKEAHVTISAVDVGILNITQFPVPDANAHFFAQRRLGPEAYDIYGRVIESYPGSSARLKFGGDMPLLALPQARRPTARVLTVDLFSGPLKLDARGIAKVKLPVPDFNGTLRVSAVAYSDEHYGNRDSEIIVRAPIVAEASMPRILAPGDRSTVTLDVQNFTGRTDEFEVRVNGEGALSITDGTRKVRLGDGAKTTLSFPLEATEGFGVANVRVRVSGMGDYQVDRRYDVPVRPAWGSVLRSETRVLNPVVPISLDTRLADGLIGDSVNARVMISAIPAIPFASALQGALDYPYGCAEQTTSKGYAALLLDDATSQLLGVTGLDAAKRRERMEGAFARLTSMQVSNGHFSMWGRDDYVNPALTPYIAEFLLDAKAAGFAIPENVLQKALNRMSEDLLSGGNQFYGRNNRDYLRFADQAYAGYVLARVNRAPLGTLRTLYDNESAKSITGLPLVRLGIALSLQGDKKRGEQAIADGFAKDPERDTYLGDYGSSVRDVALMIALTHQHALARPTYDTGAVAVGRWLELRRRRYNGNLWLSTQEQAALARMGKALIADQKKRVAGQVKIGEDVESFAPAKLLGRTFGFNELAKGITLSPSGEAPLYVSLDVAGVPKRAPDMNTSLIGIERYWYTADGEPWQPGPLREGDVLIVQLRVKSDRSIVDGLITDLVPAGLEIENFNLSGDDQWANVVIDGVSMGRRSGAANIHYEEFRDDRYVASLSLNRGQTANVFYMVRAVTPGTYSVPPTQMEDMYQPDVRGVGRQVPSTMTVVNP